LSRKLPQPSHTPATQKRVQRMASFAPLRGARPAAIHAARSVVVVGAALYVLWVLAVRNDNCVQPQRNGTFGWLLFYFPEGLPSPEEPPQCARERALNHPWGEGTCVHAAIKGQLELYHSGRGVTTHLARGSDRADARHRVYVTQLISRPAVARFCLRHDATLRATSTSNPTLSSRSSTRNPKPLTLACRVRWRGSATSGTARRGLDDTSRPRATRATNPPRTCSTFWCVSFRAKKCPSPIPRFT